MAGFRSGRGRDSRGAQQHGQFPQHPQGSPYPQQPPQQGPGPWQGGGGHGGPGGGGQGRHGEPEYFGDPPPQQYGGPAPYGAPPHDPYANNPGHTQSFSVHDPYGQDAGGGYGDAGTYSPGNAPPPPAGPRLPWKELLSGIVMRPNVTFFQMRDYPVWGPALVVTFLYGLLAVFGLDKAREDVINTTISQAIPYVLTTGVAVVLAGLILGAVTHTLARQFGGNGAWQPTVGLAMLIMSLTDAPRLLFAVFLGGNASLVQILGWATWILAGVLFTSMVSRSHDLPWPKALGASAIQLLALLFLMKLGTL